MIGPWHILAVAIGGAGGALMRFGVSHHLNQAVSTFPVATLVVNVAGSLAIGFCFIWFHEDHNPAALDNQALRDGIRVGLLGALTTFSTFSMETLVLMQDQAYGRAALNVVANVVVCLLAAWIGLLIGKAVFPAGA